MRIQPVMPVNTFDKKSIKKYSSILCLILLFMSALQSCSSSRKSQHTTESIDATEIRSIVVIKNKVPPVSIDVKNIKPSDLVNFASTLKGIPYKYGSAKKENGFDCSGYVNYVFNHFKISVPRTTVEFTNAGKEVSIRESKPGDLILFTGSDAKSGVVGHMGIINENKKNQFCFLHAASGPGVMVSEMNSYFIPRFVKVIRVFN